MKFFADKLIEAGKNHDTTKLEGFEMFYKTLTDTTPGKGVKDSDWYKHHTISERHHLHANVPEDVNLVDVIEYLTDCVMAGLSRGGKLYVIDLPPDVLNKAFANTVELLKDDTIVVGGDHLLDKKI